HEVEVLYLADLLVEALEVPQARADTIAGVLADPRLGEVLTAFVERYLNDLHPTDLAAALMSGLAHEEISPVGGLPYLFMARHDFVIAPLPTLLFTRDSSVWVHDQVAVTSLAMPARERETT